MLVRDQRRFEELMERLESEGRFALDTEFIRERTFRPRLCLVQIALPDGCFAVDPFEVEDLTPLIEALRDPALEKVVHAGQQDMEIFYARDRVVPRSVVDTQIAAALLGYGEGIGYGRLVEQVLGVKLGRGESYTDWARRPLSKEQEEYALNDVRYLFPLSERLFEELRELGREDWLREECKVYETDDFYRRPARTAYTKVSGAGKLDRRGLAVLRELAAWRETAAEERDRPRGRIISDSLMVEIARRKPRDRGDLGGLRGVHPRLLQGSGEVILAAVKRGLDCPPADLPESLDRGGRDDRLSLVVDLLDVFVKARAGEERLAPGYLASRRDLSRLAAAVLSGDDGADLPLLEGWRGEKVGNDLRALLEGRLGLGIDPRERAVTVRQGAG